MRYLPMWTAQAPLSDGMQWNIIAMERTSVVLRCVHGSKMRA